jgi:hypothetical protein
MEQALLTNSKTNLIVNGLDYTRVELHDFTHYASGGTGETSVKIIGGASAATGNWLGGKTMIFAGAAYGHYTSYDISNGAHVDIRDVWYDDGAGGEKAAIISGNSYFTYSGSPIYLSGSATSPAFTFNDFTGVAALMNLAISSNNAISITGDSTGAELLALSLVGANPAINDTSSPGATSALLNSQQNSYPPPGQGSGQVSDQGTTDESFLRSTLDHFRTEHSSIPVRRTNGVTDVRIYRVYVVNASTGIILKN